MTMRSASLAHEIGGSGPWLVLSHALAATRHMWAAQIPMLEKHFTVLRYDTPGHGESAVPDGPRSMEQLADSAYELLRNLGAKDVTWVGLSLGGMIGEALAIAHPEMVARLVIADATAGYPTEAKAMWNERIAGVERDGMAAIADGTIGRWFTEDFRRREPDTVGLIRAMILATPPAGFIACGSAVRDLDIWDDIPGISCPTLVLVGEHDMATPPAMARRIADGIPGAEFRTIPDAAHLSCVEQPEAFNAALAAFLKIA